MIRLIKGFRDVLPGEVELWQRVERTAVDLFEDFGFSELRIPIMERTELFARSIGETTDIVEKEMYTFPDRRGDLLTLRPEATASLCRAYIQHGFHNLDPVRKLYMIGPMFRRERPQKGRYRQFYQIDAEIFGVADPFADIQLIYMLVLLLHRLAVEDVTTHLNSLGCPACRPAFKEALIAFLDQRREQLCDDCRRRTEHNPLRVLDCKAAGCRTAVTEAPDLLDYLCAQCRDHFEAVTAGLTRLQIPYTVDKRLVRGLDYYTRTTFELQTGALGAQSAVVGGGRYDGLVKALGGPDTPAIGFAVGFDRLVEIVAARQPNLRKRPRLFIAALNARARELAFDWSCALNAAGVPTEMEYAARSLKSQMKRADRLGAGHVLMLGPDELARGRATLRNMATREQSEVDLADIIDNLSELLPGDRPGR